MIWESPTRADRAIIRSLGKNPDHCMVSRPGKDQMVILDLRDHRIAERETYIRLGKKQ